MGSLLRGEGGGPGEEEVKGRLQVEENGGGDRSFLQLVIQELFFQRYRQTDRQSINQSVIQLHGQELGGAWRAPVQEASTPQSSPAGSTASWREGPGAGAAHGGSESDIHSLERSRRATALRSCHVAPSSNFLPPTSFLQLPSSFLPPQPPLCLLWLRPLPPVYLFTLPFLPP